MILVVAEQRGGTLNRASWETIAAAQHFPGDLPIVVAVPGSSVRGVADDLASARVSEVVTIDHPALALYTPDGSFNNYMGQDGLRTFMKNRNGGTRRHWNTNLVITPTSEGAKGTVYLMFVDVGMKPPGITSAGKYEDTLVKTQQGWRFKKRQTFPDPAAAPASATPPPQNPK